MTPANDNADYLRAALALACALVAGAVIQVIEIVGPMLVKFSPSPNPLLRLEIWLRLAATSSFAYAAIIAALCAPCWWMLGRAGRQSAAAAMALGFAMSFGCGVATQLYFGEVPDAVQALAFAVPGAAAGLVAWLVLHPSSLRPRTAA